MLTSDDNPVREREREGEREGDREEEIGVTYVLNKLDQF